MATLLFVLNQAVAADFPSFEPKSFQLFQGKTFEDALIGKFDRGSCAQMLARREEDKQLWLASRDLPALPVSGIPPDFPLRNAIVLDLNEDGLSDLVSFQANGKQWSLALSLGGGQFSSRTFALPDLDLSQGASGLLAPLQTPTNILLDGNSKIYIFKYSAEHGLDLEKIMPKGEGGRVLGFLVGKQDRALDPPFSSLLYSIPDAKGRVMRTTPDRVFTWADFPDYVNFERMLIGDFDGDGFSDALAPSEIFGSWWIALGNRENSIEYPVSHSTHLATQVEDLTVGDFDCDGRDDLLQRHVEQGNAQLFLSGVESTLIRRTESSSERSKVGRALGDEQGPYVCVGYVPSSSFDKWGYSSVCPEGYAIYDSRFTKDYTVGSCCRLPLPDILTKVHSVETSGRCPENSIATGVILPAKLRCTQINTKRYALALPTSGIYWGFSARQNNAQESVLKERIPLGIRFGIGRNLFQAWSPEGCLGYPWGALLTKWGPEDCKNSEFRTLVYSGLASVPPKGTAVQMFPNCKAGVNPFDPNAGCILAEPQQSVHQR